MSSERGTIVPGALAVTRPLLLLLLAAAVVTCVVGVPVIVFGGDDDARVARATGPRDDDATSTTRSAGDRLGWLRRLAGAASASAGDPPRDRATEGLAVLDRTVGAGVERCAPEVFGYDRDLLGRLQSNWRVLKPDLGPSWQAWLAMDGVVVDDARVAACEEAFAGDDCDAMRTAWDDCAEPFRGTLEEGDACETNEQCASTRCVDGACAPTNRCASSASCPAGTLCAVGAVGATACVDAPHAGDPCLTPWLDDDDGDDGTDPSCGGALVCNLDDTCVAARGLGEACGPAAPCAADLECDTGDRDVIELDSVTGRCARPADVDVDGRTALDGLDHITIRALLADDDAPLAAVDVGDAAVDVDVGAVDDAAPGCSCDPYQDGMACVDGPDGDSVQCVPVELVDDGDACDATHICRGSLGIAACIDGRCGAALGEGDPCLIHDECKDDLVCIHRACTPPLHAGAACMDSDDCIFGLDCVDRGDGAVCAVAFETAGAGDMPEEDVVVEDAPDDGAPVDGEPVDGEPVDGEPGPEDLQRLYDVMQAR